MTYTTIEIYCQDSSHHEKPWVIDRFARTGPGEWVTLPPGIRDDRMRTDPHTHQRINELDDTHIGAGPLQPPVSVRYRYKLRCPKSAGFRSRCAASG